MKPIIEGTSGILAAALAVCLIGCRSAGAGMVEGLDRKVQADPGLKAVEVVLDGAADIEFGASSAAVEAVDVRYKGYVGDPLTVERDGSTVRVRLAKGPMFSDSKARFTLRLPPGLDVSLKGGATRLSGTLAARKVVIHSGALDLGGRIEADALTVSGGAVSIKGLTAKVGRADVSGGAVSVEVTLEGDPPFDVRGGAVSGTVKGSTTVRVLGSGGAGSVDES